MWEGLLRARKMEAISRLAGGIAHDFNNLLTSIVGYTGLLKLGRSDDKTRGAVDGIESAAYRAADLIRKLMAFSRRQHLRARLVDLNDLIRGMQGSLKELLGDSVTMSMRLTSEPGWARADPALLQQAINAIAANAREAMTQGGTLSIETGTLVLGASHFPGRSNEPTGVWLVLSFADTGEGMDAAVASRLFEPYFTTREFGKGAGLGLATAYGIVEQSGGHIDAQSAPGQGTTIRIYLPRVEVSDSRLEPAPPC